jgi:hypothetical protein
VPADGCHNGSGSIAVAIYRLLQTLVFEPEDVEKLAMAYTLYALCSFPTETIR